MNVDAGIFWGMVVMVLLMGILPLFMRGQKWAIISFFGFLLALLITTTIAGDGSIAVAYKGDGTAITNPDNLPITVMGLLAIMNVFITVGKGLDVV